MFLPTICRTCLRSVSGTSPPAVYIMTSSRTSQAGRDPFQSFIAAPAISPSHALPRPSPEPRGRSIAVHRCRHTHYQSRIANHNHRRLCLPTIARPVPTHTYTLLPTPYVAGRFRRSSLRRSPPATRHTPYHKCCCLVAVGQHQSGHRRCIFRSSSTIR
jgi:hypothetical protein